MVDMLYRRLPPWQKLFGVNAAFDIMTEKKCQSLYAPFVAAYN
jgi:hypothetical protein